MKYTIRYQNMKAEYNLKQTQLYILMQKAVALHLIHDKNTQDIKIKTNLKSSPES